MKRAVLYIRASALEHVAAMEEEELARNFRKAFSALQSGLAGGSEKVKNKSGKA